MRAHDRHWSHQQVTFDGVVETLIPINTEASALAHDADMQLFPGA